MAKKSRARVGTAGAVLAVSIAGASLDHAAAAGLPLRASAPAHDRALAGLSENLDFKLRRFDKNVQPEGLAAWSAMVDETLLIAQRLGCAPATPATAQRIGQTYAVVLEGDSVVAGSDPDQVLGRLLFMLAHAAPPEGETRTAAALSILDQPLSATLAALPLTSTP
jgi:hypothetical protein